MTALLCLFTSHSQSRSTLPSSWSNQRTSQIQCNGYDWLFVSCCTLHDNIRLKLDTSQLLKLYSKPLSSLQLQHFLLVTSLSPLLTISNPGCQTDIKEKPSDGYSSWQTAMRKKTPMLTLRETGSWSPKFLAQRTHTGAEAMAIEAHTAVRHSEPMSDQERRSSSQSELLLAL